MGILHRLLSRPSERNLPSYHDLHITTDTYPRTSIFDLPYGYEITCNRVGGWGLWHDGTMVAGEYEPRGLCIDVAGHIICDNLTPRETQDPK